MKKTDEATAPNTSTIPLLDRVRADEIETQKANLKRYREVLSRNENPSPKDVCDLRILIERLGKTPEAVEEDLVVLGEVANLQARLETQPEIEARRKKVAKELELFRQKKTETLAALSKAEDALLNKIFDERDLLQDLKRDRDALDRMKISNPNLFGQPEPDPAEMETAEDPNE